jgi:hypothetical protein
MLSVQPVWSARMVARYRRDLRVAAGSWMLAVDSVPTMSCGPDTSPPWSTGRTLLLTPKVSQTVTRYPYGYYGAHMDTDTRRDKAGSAQIDPALDAAYRLHHAWFNGAYEGGNPNTDLVLIRDALADRLTTPELDIIFQIFQNGDTEWAYTGDDPEYNALCDRLGLMADRAKADGR